MRTLTVVAIILLAFASFFLTFLVAPLAVLAIFHVVYATRSSGSAAPPPAAEPRPLRDWQTEDSAQPEVEPTPEVPARRARITVIERELAEALDVVDS